MKSLSNRERALLSFNSFVSLSHKYVYIAVPKAACTAMKQAIATLEGEHPEEHSKDSWEVDTQLLIHPREGWRTPSLLGVDEDLRDRALRGNDWFRFALVRNPYTRLFSAWQSKLLLREPAQSAPYVGAAFFEQEIRNLGDISKAFEAFLLHLEAVEWPNPRSDHWMRQVDLLFADSVAYSCIGRIEEMGPLLDRFNAHLARFGATLPPLLRANESLIPWDPALLTPRSEQLIRELFAADFSNLGYSPVPPPCVRALPGAAHELVVLAIHAIRARHERFGDIHRILDSERRRALEVPGTLPP